MQNGWVVGHVKRGQQPRESASIAFRDGLFGELGHFIENALGLSAPHVVDHPHVPQMHGMARDVLFAHVLGHFGFGREVSVRKRIAGQDDHLFARGFDGATGHFSKFHHDFLHDFHGVVGR